MDISAMVISVITYVAIIEMLANGLVGDCLANQIDCNVFGATLILPAVPIKFMGRCWRRKQD